MDGIGPGLDIRPLSGALGAEVLGVDLTVATPSELDEIGQAFLEHQVLVFRSQFLDPAAYARIARHFGEPVEYPFAKGIEGFPEITVIAKEPDQTSNFGGMWHSDTTYKPEPPAATMLFCIETPTAGGDTLFACQYRAYDALSPGLQQLLAGLNGVSSSAKNASALRATHLSTGSMKGTGKKDTLTSVHPAVRVHPKHCAGRFM